MNTVGILFALVTQLVVTTPPPTVSATDVRKVVGCMQLHTCKNTLATKGYPDGGDQIVFLDSGMRYTFYWGGGKDGNFLSVWARHDGTSDQVSLETFTDYSLDGSVDFGIRGPTSGTDAERHYFMSGREPWGKAKGLEFETYWQKEYAGAIAVALRQLF